MQVKYDLRCLRQIIIGIPAEIYLMLSAIINRIIFNNIRHDFKIVGNRLHILIHSNLPNRKSFDLIENQNEKYFNKM